MASKPLDQLTPAYRRRIERAIAKGKTKQQARGHKVKEHVIRKKREISSGQLISSQKQEIRKFARMQAKRLDIELMGDELAEEIIEWTNGDYSSFVSVRNEQKLLVKEYKSDRLVHRKATDFESAMSSYGAPIEWFYYH